MLSSLATGKDERLSGGGQAMLKGYLQLLGQLRRQIATVTREVRRQVTRTPEAKRLTTIPGIGIILAHTVVAEVGDMKRFRSAKHLASYSLLAPRAYDSGEETDDTPKGRHVGHIGRRTLKWAWIEAAHGAVRSGGRFREMYDGYTDNGKRNKNRGYIVVAHELCRIAYSISKREADYRDDPPERPGSSRKRSPLERAARRKRKEADRRRRLHGAACQGVTSGNSCPGTGLPEDPMVAVG